MASTRVRSSRRDRFRDGSVSVGRSSRQGNLFPEGRPLRVGSEIVVRSIDSGGSTIRALRVATKLRLQGSALAAALASPAVSSALANVSYRTGAGHTTGLSVVYQQVEPLTTVVRESAVSAGRELEVAWRGADGLLDQMPDPEPMDGSPTRAAVDWHELAKRAPDVDDERSMPALADREVLRRRGRVTGRRGLPAPADVDRGRRAHGRASRPGPRLRANRAGGRLRAHHRVALYRVALDLGEQREERGHDLRLDVLPALDLDVLLEGLSTQMAGVRTEIANLDTRLSTQIAEVRPRSATSSPGSSSGSSEPWSRPPA